MDYEKIIHAIIDPIIEEPDSVLIKVMKDDNDKDIAIFIASEKDDTARLIGRHGNVASAIREVISVAGKSEEKRIHVKFESFDEEEKEEE